MFSGCRNCFRSFLFMANRAFLMLCSGSRTCCFLINNLCPAVISCSSNLCILFLFCMANRTFFMLYSAGRAGCGFIDYFCPVVVSCCRNRYRGLLFSTGRTFLMLAAIFTACSLFINNFYPGMSVSILLVIVSVVIIRLIIVIVVVVIYCLRGII